MVGHKKSNHIDNERIAHITSWRNNCAVSATAAFLIDAMQNDLLPPATVALLTEHYNEYYDTQLSPTNFCSIFKSYLTHPADQQVILGMVLRAQLGNDIDDDKERMLDSRAFSKLAKLYRFNYSFYIKESELDENAPIVFYKTTIIKRLSNLHMYIFFHDAHFDLIMHDAAKAKAYNSFATKLGNKHIHLEDDKANERYDYIRKISKRAAFTPHIKDFTLTLGVFLLSSLGIAAGVLLAIFLPGVLAAGLAGAIALGGLAAVFCALPTILSLTGLVTIGKDIAKEVKKQRPKAVCCDVVLQQSHNEVISESIPGKSISYPSERRQTNSGATLFSGKDHQQTAPGAAPGTGQPKPQSPPTELISIVASNEQDTRRRLSI